MPDSSSMEWLPAISTTGVFAVSLWILRKYIGAKLIESVKHEYDTKLEAMRAEIERKQSQITALRSGALSSAQTKSTLLYQKKIEASEAIWATVVSLTPAKNLSEMLSGFKVGVLQTEAAKNPDLREVFKAISSGYDPKSLGTIEAHRYRPYCSKMLWALFSTYTAIVIRAVIRVEMIKAGIDKDFTKDEHLKGLIGSVLPHQIPLIEKYGIDASHYLIEELETNMIAEISRIHQSSEDDEESIKRAADILAKSEKVMADNEAMQNP